MPSFKKKPVIIQAYQITRELLESIIFDGQPYPAGLTHSSAGYNKENRTISAWFGRVVGIDGQYKPVVENDWIITEPDGIHHLPCKPDTFVNSYDPV